MPLSLYHISRWRVICAIAAIQARQRRNDRDGMQPQNILTEVIKWAATDYKPDVVIVDHGPHSAFKKLSADNFAGSMRDIGAVLSAWRARLVRAHAACTL